MTLLNYDLSPGDAWKKLEIDQDLVDDCDANATTAYNENGRKYWEACRNFLNDIKFKNYKDLSVKQRNWVKTIKDGIEDDMWADAEYYGGPYY